MPPKAQTTTRRVRAGRAAATEPAAPVAVTTAPSLPKKRGRPPKVNGTVEPPKKRGRPAKVQTDETIAQIDKAIKRGRRSVAAAEEVVAEAPVPRKKRGRPVKVTETIVAANEAAAPEAAAPKKRGGRPRKEVVVVEAPATPKRRGRAPLDLTRVAGPSRVSKRTSPRSKPVAKIPPKASAAPRINPKMRSRLRHRAVPAEKSKKEIAQPVKKGRGRPKKVVVETEAPVPKKTLGRGRKASAPTPAAGVKKVTARPKVAAPRKRRGYTALEVPDKFAAQIRQFLTELQAEDVANAEAAAGLADDEGEVEAEEVMIEEGDVMYDAPKDDVVEPDGIEPLVEEFGDDAPAPTDGFAEGSEVDGAARESTEEESEEDDQVHVGDMDGAADAPLEEDALAREDEAPVPQSDMDDDFADETELPDETAVLAEIAAVQRNIDAQADGVVQTGLERAGSSSSISVDLHQEITGITSHPQAEGPDDVETFHAHIDEHVHLHEPAHVPERSTNPELLFG
ncbi:hypothetical protein E8E13_007748 [Curvularia kusanoi]|uniref:Uncharacterized protein n=1 Tax=Curvularia kusanoi TaxID=90978 RepID=A0A9P4TN75_CURKU|nr:hypothetical protein E8E13_007748 [Curvularia kusanoi]